MFAFPKEPDPLSFDFDDILAGNEDSLTLIEDDKDEHFHLKKLRLPSGAVLLSLPNGMIVSRGAYGIVQVYAPDSDCVAELDVSMYEGFVCGFYGDLPSDVGLSVGAYRAGNWDGAIHLSVPLPNLGKASSVNVAMFPSDQIAKEDTFIQIQIEIWKSV